MEENDNPKGAIERIQKIKKRAKLNKKKNTLSVDILETKRRASIQKESVEPNLTETDHNNILKRFKTIVAETSTDTDMLVFFRGGASIEEDLKHSNTNMPKRSESNGNN